MDMRTEVQKNENSVRSITRFSSLVKKQGGFNVIEFLIFVAFLVLLGLVVIPNVNLFLGVDRKLAAANVEAFNVRAAAIAYQDNNGKYPVDSDVLWHDPSQSGDYLGQPHAYYSIDIGTGRILDATTDTVGHIPADPWKGIRWDYASGSWVKE
jgi:type II secretory pathway pseudopilin PulG